MDMTDIQYIDKIRSRVAAKYDEDLADIFVYQYHWYLRSGIYEHDHAALIGWAVALLGFGGVLPFAMIAFLNLGLGMLLSGVLALAVALAAAAIGWPIGCRQVRKEALAHAWQMMAFTRYMREHDIDPDENKPGDGYQEGLITGYVVGRNNGS